MKIKYVGLSKAVQIAATGQWAEQGKPVDVDDKVARDLLKQDIWQKTTVKKTVKKEEEE